MRFTVITLFPKLISSFISEGLLGKAVVSGAVKIEVVNLHDYGLGKHQNVDDYPYGGGAGMLIKPEPIFNALAANAPSARKILISPQGVPLKQEKIIELSNLDDLAIVCGRYEGFDARVSSVVDEEVSLGDFILMGGELGALCLIESVSRIVTGVLGNQHSIRSETFSENLLEYDQYTKPREYAGLKVPEVLLSGNHQKIRDWRRNNALEKTKHRRPDLFRKHLISQ